MCQMMMLASCPQQVVRVWLVEFGERHDTRTNSQHHTVDGRPIRKACGKLDEDVTRHTRHPRSILITSYEDVACAGRVQEDATRKLIPWNLGILIECRY